MFYNHDLTKSRPNYYVSRVKDVKHFDWFFLLNMSKILVLNFSVTEFLCRSCFGTMFANLPATTSFIYIYNIY